MAPWVSQLILLLLFPLTVIPFNSDLITQLPGQPPNSSFKQYSGYVLTDTNHGRALFYYFVEADAHDSISRPLTLWLNGGPGCSSLGFGAFMEHGPFQPGDNFTLIHNKYSWNLESNVLYVESPIGVGFSYSNTSSDYIHWNDTTTAKDNLRFLINWFEKFPAYRDSDLYLTGESYAGHYIPQLATLLVDYNKQPNIRPIKLKAIALGNPLLDLDISVNSEDFLWAHGVISDSALKLQKTVCNISTYLRFYVHDQYSQACNDVFNIVNDELGPDTDRGDILLPICLSNGSSLQGVFPKGIHGKIQAKRSLSIRSGDPCLGDRVFAYLNKPEVQKALHANITHLPFHWDFCSGSLSLSYKKSLPGELIFLSKFRPLVYQEDNLDMDVMPLMVHLLNENIPVLLYSGDQDAKIPLTQTRIIANQLANTLKLFSITKYAPWYDKKQVILS
ncbi:serine carboxypeptidase-like 45, partial [Amborella trichopoda]